IGYRSVARGLLRSRVVPGALSRLVFLHGEGPHRDLHSFPTRRSSDLKPLMPSKPPETGPEMTDAIAEPLRNSAMAIASVISGPRSEEHTSELQSREISYAVFCLKKKKMAAPGGTAATERPAWAPSESR